VFSSIQGISLGRTFFFAVLFAGCMFTQVQGQLLEDRSKLKTVKRETRGFLFFQKKVKKGKPTDQQSTKRESANVQYSTPVNYNRKERQVNVRTSQPVKESFINRLITQQLRSKRRTPPLPSSSPFGKQFNLIPNFGNAGKIGQPRFSKPVRENFFSRQIAILKGKGTGTPNVASLYGKSRLSLISEYVRRRNLSISGSMSYDINRRLAEQFRPTSGFTSVYKGDLKVKIPILAAIQKRIGQWEKSSYRGRYIGFSELGKRHYFKSKSLDVAQNEGYMKVPIPFISGINEKLKIWEQYNFRGRGVGFTEFGKDRFLKDKAQTASNFEGSLKIKKHKGGDPHPSMAYITGKKFTSHKWKEKWRKLNVLWVRVNPGKEESEGSRVKVKTKYDKDERDIWTY